MEGKFHGHVMKQHRCETRGQLELITLFHVKTWKANRGGAFDEIEARVAVIIYP